MLLLLVREGQFTNSKVVEPLMKVNGKEGSAMALEDRGGPMVRSMKGFGKIIVLMVRENLLT